MSSISCVPPMLFCFYGIQYPLLPSCFAANFYLLDCLLSCVLLYITLSYLVTIYFACILSTLQVIITPALPMYLSLQFLWKLPHFVPRYLSHNTEYKIPYFSLILYTCFTLHAYIKYTQTVYIKTAPFKTFLYLQLPEDTPTTK